VACAGGPDSDDGDPRVVAALREYRAALDAGRRPNRSEFLARFTEVAGELAACLEGLEFVHAAARDARRFTASSELGDTVDAESVPAVLGDYRIVRSVGRGGMGIVYEAEQVSLGRRVALKVLPSAAALDARQLQRFQNEARAAAQLQHPHIVPVLAVGCEAGVHYYAMQFVDGHSLAELIAAGPTPDPQHFRAAVRLLVQAAEALEHAHQCGVVHRDVKPANLMVDCGGRLWVTDFGLARVRGDAGLTASGDVVGTLRYMSPEQALANRAVLDHRTDIYSLGATAYELLTLRPPFAESDREALLRRIALDEPRRPRRVTPAVPRDLETVVLKAMEKSPADRYASAQELADDLRRFLGGEPVRARRARPWQVAARWARRHTAVVAVTAVAVAVVLVVLAGAVVRLSAANRQLRDQQAQTEAARGAAALNAAEARQQAERAERTAGAALHALHNVALEFADGRLKDDPLWGKRAERFLDETVITCRELAGLEGASPWLRASAAAGCRRAALAYAELGRAEKAKQVLAEALAWTRALVREFPDDFVLRFQLASGHRQFGLLLRSLGESQAAEQFRHAIDTWNDPQPMSPCPFEASESHDNLGDLRAEAGDGRGAEEHYRRALGQRQRLLAMSDGDHQVRFRLAHDHARLAQLRRLAGDRADAERHLRQASDFTGRLAREHPNVPDYALGLAECCLQLGNLYEVADPPAASAHFRRALEILPKLVAEHPGLTAARHLLAEIHIALGSLGTAGAATARQPNTSAALATSSPRSPRIFPTAAAVLASPAQPELPRLVPGGLPGPALPRPAPGGRAGPGGGCPGAETGGLLEHARDRLLPGGPPGRRGQRARTRHRVPGRGRRRDRLLLPGDGSAAVGRPGAVAAGLRRGVEVVEPAPGRSGRRNRPDSGRSRGVDRAVRRARRSMTRGNPVGARAWDRLPARRRSDRTRHHHADHLPGSIAGRSAAFSLTLSSERSFCRISAHRARRPFNSFLASVTAVVAWLVGVASAPCRIASRRPSVPATRPRLASCGCG
jgi:tetratricopeptide (TPR) repeat protein